MAKALAAFAFLALLLSSCSAYSLNWTREQMLAYYQGSMEPKLPRTAKLLLGDERINAYVGGKALGIETKHGELYSFEMAALSSPTIVVGVDDSAIQNLSAGRCGILAAIDSGEITVEPQNFFSAIKLEAMKRIYAASGADRKLFGANTAPWQAANSANSLYVQRARVEN